MTCVKAICYREKLESTNTFEALHKLAPHKGLDLTSQLSDLFPDNAERTPLQLEDAGRVFHVEDSDQLKRGFTGTAEAPAPESSWPISSGSY